MNCSDVSERLSAVYDGELSGTERDAVTEHLSVCMQCASEFSNFESLSHAIRESPLPPVPASVWTGIAAQMSPGATSGPAFGLDGQVAQAGLTQARPAKQVWLPVLALAASILFVLGTGFWFSQRSGNAHLGHQHDGEFAAAMDLYLQTLEDDPEGAEQFLLDKYHGKTVDPESAVRLVGYRPAVAQGLPEGYSLTSTSVLDMPCCTCVKAVCKRRDGSTLVLFEHDDEQTAWFGQRPSNMAMCGDTECCLVSLDSSLAATWKRGSRSVTAVGVRDQAEVSKFVSWLDSKTGKG